MHIFKGNFCSSCSMLLPPKNSYRSPTTVKLGLKTGQTLVFIGRFFRKTLPKGVFFAFFRAFGLHFLAQLLLSNTPCFPKNMGRKISNIGQTPIHLPQTKQRNILFFLLSVNKGTKSFARFPKNSPQHQ